MKSELSAVDWADWATPADRLPGGGVILFQLGLLLFITDICNTSERLERGTERVT